MYSDIKTSSYLNLLLSISFCKNCFKKLPQSYSLYKDINELKTLHIKILINFSQIFLKTKKNLKTSLALYPRVSLNIGDINQVLCKFPPWRVTSHLPNSQIFNIKNSSNVMVLSHVVPNLWLNQSFGPFFTFSWTCLQSTVCLSVGKTINSSKTRVIIHIFA